MINQIEVTTIIICCNRPLLSTESRQLRGFFGQRYRNRPEFHHHGHNGLIYRHPLIQYKTVGGVGRVMGIGAGSFLLQAVDPPDRIILNGKAVEVLEANQTTKTVDFGPTSGPISYRFLIPWLALNETNFQSYRQMRNNQERHRLLNRVLVGNLLSLCKSVGESVEERLVGKVIVDRTEPVEIKKDVTLIGVCGGFEVNFLLPDMWGIGKQSARGFGAVHKIKE